MIVVDTNILIGVFKKHPQSTALLRQWEQQSAIGISIVSYLELLSGVTPKETKHLQKSLSDFMIIPFAESTVAEIAAQYRQLFALATPDAIVAASCEFGSHHLYTYDQGFDRLGKRWIHVVKYEA